MDTTKFKDIFMESAIDISEPIFPNKKTAFQHMVRLLHHAECIHSEEEFLNALYEREHTGSTYIGDGFAIPHGVSETVAKSGVSFCRCQPFCYQSNGEMGNVSLIIMLAIPKGAKGTNHIQMLAKISRLLMNENFRNVLLNSRDVKEIISVGTKELYQLSEF